MFVQMTVVPTLMVMVSGENPGATEAALVYMVTFAQVDGVQAAAVELVDVLLVWNGATSNW